MKGAEKGKTINQSHILIVDRMRQTDALKEVMMILLQCYNMNAMYTNAMQNIKVMVKTGG